MWSANLIALQKDTHQIHNFKMSVHVLYMLMFCLSFPWEQHSEIPYCMNIHTILQYTCTCFSTKPNLELFILLNHIGTWDKFYPRSTMISWHWELPTERIHLCLFASFRRQWGGLGHVSGCVCRLKWNWQLTNPFMQFSPWSIYSSNAKCCSQVWINHDEWSVYEV